MNRENFKLVLDKIIENPEQWDQQWWHSDCGTRHCFAGWAQILAGKEPLGWEARRDATVFLSITYKEGQYLFSPERTLIDFKEFYNEREKCG